MNYKYIKLFIICVALAVPSATVAPLSASTPMKTLKPAPEVEGMTVRITSQAPSFNAGAPAYVDVYLTNNRDTPVSLANPPTAEEALTVNVMKGNGKPCQLTAFGYKNYNKPNYSKRLTMPYGALMRSLETNKIVAPHQALHFRLLLNRLYDLSEEGSYSVTVSQWIPKLDGSGVTTIVSMPFNFEIINESNETLTPGTTNPVDEGESGSGFTIGEPSKNSTN